MDKTDKYLIIFLINTIIISLVCLSPVHGEVYLIQPYVIKFVRSPVIPDIGLYQRKIM